MKEIEDLTYSLEKLEIYKTELEAQNIELREIETKLREKGEENEALFLDAPIPYLIIDRKYNIIKWNKLAEKLFNFEKFKTVKSKIFSFYFLKQNLNIFLEWITNKDYLNYSINLEVSIGKKTEIFKIQASEYSLNKKFIMLSMISIQKEIDLFDETKKKDMLLESQSKMALLGEMLNNISHQWRQPLSTMTVAASGIKLKKELNILEEDTLVEFLDAILDNSKFLSKTIDDFRDFALNKYEDKEFDIKITIEKTLAIFKSKLQDKNIDIVMNLDPILFKGSESQLMQVFINLLSNSIDQFTNSSNQNKIIIIENKKYKDYFSIEFSDNAGGIPLSIQDNIFEPYFTTKYKSTGTGIGLYMSSRIIKEQFQGELSCENRNINFNETNDLGATFIITLYLNE